MTDEKQKKIFSRNLLELLAESGKTQKEVADKIHVSPQTFNTWCRGIALPRMGKVQAIADYFGVPKSKLLEENFTTSFESRMIAYLNILNRYGRETAINRVQELTLLDKYTKGE